MLSHALRTWTWKIIVGLFVAPPHVSKENLILTLWRQQWHALSKSRAGATIASIGEDQDPRQRVVATWQSFVNLQSWDVNSTDHLTTFTFRGWKWQCPMPILLAKLSPHKYLKNTCKAVAQKLKVGLAPFSNPFGFQMKSMWQATYLSYFWRLGVDYKHQGSWRHLAAKQSGGSSTEKRPRHPMMRKLVSRTTLSKNVHLRPTWRTPCTTRTLRPDLLDLKSTLQKGNQINLLVRAQGINDYQIHKMSCKYIVWVHKNLLDSLTRHHRAMLSHLRALIEKSDFQTHIV